MTREYFKSPRQIEVERAEVAWHRRELWISPLLYLLTLAAYALPRTAGLGYPAARGGEMVFAVVIGAISIALHRAHRPRSWGIVAIRTALFCALPLFGMLTLALPSRSFEAVLDQAANEGVAYARLTDVEPDPSRTLGWTDETRTRQARDQSQTSSVERDYRPYQSSSSHRYRVVALVARDAAGPAAQRPVRAWLLCEVLPSSACGEATVRFNGSVRRVTRAAVVDWLSERGAGFPIWEPLDSVEAATRETSQRAIRAFHVAFLALYGYLMLRFMLARRVARASTFRG